MEIDDSSILFLKKYLILRLRDVYYAYHNRVKNSIHYDVTWEAVNELILVVFRLGLITSSTYFRMKRLMLDWDAYKKP